MMLLQYKSILSSQSYPPLAFWVSYMHKSAQKRSPQHNNSNDDTETICFGCILLNKEMAEIKSD